MKLARLLNSVYGAEQLLLLARQDDEADGADDRLLPTLLSFDQGSTLEAELGGGAFGGTFARMGKLLARQGFFEAVGGAPLNPWEMAQRAQSASVATVMYTYLEENGLAPDSVTLGSIAEEEEVSTVGMRDMGANTPAAPTSVRLTAELPATLMCTTEDAGRQVVVPLGGAADAVILAQHASQRGRPLPLWVSLSLWQRRAVLPERLPETTVEQACTLESSHLAGSD